MNGFKEDFAGWDNLHITKRSVEAQAKRWREGTKHGAKTKSQSWDVVAKAAQELCRIKSADEKGMAECFTCTSNQIWNDGMEGGHWIKRQYRATKTLQANLRPQCHVCNNYKGGREEIFARNLGKRITDRLQRMKSIAVDWSFEQIAKRLLVIRYRIKQHKERII